MNGNGNDWILQSQQGDNTMEQKKILIVDDDIELGDLLAKAVGDMSDAYTVKVARDVDEAMVQVQKSQTDKAPFDLVITDIKMTGLSGLELLEALNSIAPETKTMAMTAYNSSELTDRARELGVHAYLTKPFIISEFRQIVRNALSSGPFEANSESEPDIALTSAQDVLVRRQLASMRTMTGAGVTLFAHTSGAILATDALEPDINIDGLCTALINAQRTISQQMTQTFDQGIQIEQSYFGTDTYNICTYRLDESYFVAVVFGPAVKEGQVWYYMREAVNELRNALASEGERPTARRRVRKGNVFDMLDQFFPNREKRSRGRKSAASAETAPTKVASAVESPVQTEAAPQVEAVPAADLSAVDDMDWDVSTDMDWDTLIEDTDQGFDGMDLEEAQKQGLLSQDLAETLAQDQEPTTETEPPSDRPPVDDIDWDVSTDMDWDTLVEDTDQGFGGMSFEEAQKRGLVNDLEDE